jgi:uncharacterized protein YggU (UPF0235/DUF167 family)
MESLFDIKVVPCAGRQAWKLDKNGQLKCYLKSAAEKNKANNELVELLSKALSLPKQDITIVSGLTSRKKRIKLAVTLTFEQLLGHLGIEVQKAIF